VTNSELGELSRKFITVFFSLEMHLIYLVIISPRLH